MKIKNITETVAGSVASVAMPLGATRRRTTETVKVAGLQPAEKVMTGKAKKKGPYANSLTEGKMKELQLDLTSGKDGLTDIEFKKKYGKTKDEMRKSLKQKPEQKKDVAEGSLPGQAAWKKEMIAKGATSFKRDQHGGGAVDRIVAYDKDGKVVGGFNRKGVAEAKLEEDDVIIVPGQGHRLKSGFIPHSEDRTDHEVEMALSDLFQAAKNAKQVYDIVKTYSEEQGLEGWVQEKIIKANDYLNTIREYLEHRQLTREGTLGSVAGGIAGAVIGKSPSAAITGAELGSALQDKLTNETGAGVIAGGLQYEDKEIEPGPYATALNVMKKIFDIAKSGEPGTITIRNKTAEVSVPKAKAFIHVYRIAQQSNRVDDFLQAFIDTTKLTRLLKSQTWSDLVKKYSQETPQDYRQEKGAKTYQHVAQQTGNDPISTSGKEWVAEKAVSKKAVKDFAKTKAQRLA